MESDELHFSKKEVEVLHEVVKFLNQQYATQNFVRFGNQAPPDFNKGRLSDDEEKEFWKKLGF